MALSGNNIGDEGAAILSDLLEERGTGVRNLNLWRNHITDKGAIRIAQALEKNDSLTCLNLTGILFCVMFHIMASRKSVPLVRAAKNHEP